MIDGLGIAGWGVGGIEAEAVMLGQAISMVLPEVVGFRLTGKLDKMCTATDLVLTCTSVQSRNYSLGVALGEGRALADVLGERNSVAEGVYTASAATALAARIGIEMPIAAAIDAVLNQGTGIDTVIEALLARPLRTETD